MALEVGSRLGRLRWLIVRMPSASRLNKRHSIRAWAMLGALLVALGYAILERNPTGPAGAQPTLDDSSVVRLYEEKRSGEMVEGVGIVERVLRDDEDGSRHQRFIVSLGSGLTLLVSHNIDLAPRVANLEPGDEVFFVVSTSGMTKVASSTGHMTTQRGGAMGDGWSTKA